MLFNEPKLLKYKPERGRVLVRKVSVLFNEPKLLKFPKTRRRLSPLPRFSALQRAEIAEMDASSDKYADSDIVSVLFNEPKLLKKLSCLRGRCASSPFQCSSTSRNC